MKKLAFVAILLIAITMLGFSQSLQISNQHGVIPSNSEIIQVGSPDSTELLTYINVKNIGTKDLQVLCRKTEYKLLDSTEVTMCWAGGCYPPTTHVSPFAQLITVGQTITDFSGHYTQVAFHHFMSGETVVRWSFFDKANVNDSVSVLIKYITYPLGVSEPVAQQASLSNSFPNPASGQACMTYELPAGSTGTVLIRDMIGKTVYTDKLTASTGKVVVNTMEFPEGIYFCSLIQDGKTVQTRKIIVRH